MFVVHLPFGDEKKEVIIDEDLKEKFLNFPCEWHIKELDGKLFVMSTAFSKGKSYSIFLHQLVLNCEKHEEVLFMNQNTLDNRKYNVRLKSNLPKRVVKG